MYTAVIIVFVLGYMAIAFEYSLRLNKSISALAMAILCWSLIYMGSLPVFKIDTTLKTLELTYFNSLFLHHLRKTSEILIFLVSAMVIVEIIDMHLGFDFLKIAIKTQKKTKLLWILNTLAFFLSAIIDNLTTTIILITILRKLIPNSKERRPYIGILIIAINAGGAWSPIGDVTTTMLWISNKITPEKLIEYVFIPSILSMVIPTFIASFMSVFKGGIVLDRSKISTEKFEKSSLILYLGLSMILFTPIFKVLIHLPPYIGMVFSLIIVCIVAEYIKFSNSYNNTPLLRKFYVFKALGKIDFSNILFFLGILLVVGALESLGILFHFANWLNKGLFSPNTIVIILGGISSIIDNIPLVAVILGMFSYPIDDMFWHFIAYASGTGGSLLIIGSAAGLAAMGMEKINFFWYLKKVSWIALLGYLGGYFWLII